MIDRTRLDRLQHTLGGDPSDLADLILVFLEDMPGQLARAVTAAASGDADRVRLVAHSIKSNAFDLGVSPLDDLSAALEHDLRANPDLTGLTLRVEALTAAWAEAQPAVAAECDRLNAEAV